MSEEILIAGAGIGGLTTALSLHQAGFPVRVFESVPTIEPLGVGINLLPHAVRELDELGLLPRLRAEGVECRELNYRTKRGEPIWSEPRGLAAGYRWPQISIHRGTLQMLLLQAAIEEIGADRIHPGHRVQDVRNETDRVVLSMVDPNDVPLAEASGALFVAADGIHSAVRKRFYPDEGAPSWNGAIMWRGVAEAPRFHDGHTMIMAGHPNQKFVCYPISHNASLPDHQLINFIAERRVDTSDFGGHGDWNRRADTSDILPFFEDWQFDWLDVPALIRGADSLWVYPMIDRDPLPRWTHGRITLLGDAAHPMYPIGSNGASQAIIDARTLTGCLLAMPSDPAAALLRYEAERRPKTAKIVEANRGMGPELPMQLVEERAPRGFNSLDDVISPTELRGIAEEYKRIAGFSITELNTRDSLADPKIWRNDGP